MKNIIMAIIVSSLTIAGCKKKVEDVPTPVQTQKSSKKNIEKISFKETEGFVQKVDTIDKKIYLVFKQNESATSLTPILTLSPSATSNFTDNKVLNFNTPQTVEITAQDGSKAVYTIESVYSDVRIFLAFFYDLNNDGKTEETEASFVSLRQGDNFSVANKPDKFYFSTGKLSVNQSSTPIYLSNNLINSYTTYFRIERIVLNKDIVGTYKAFPPEVVLNFSLGSKTSSSYSEQDFQFKNTAEITIDKYDAKFNTISGSIKNGQFNVNATPDKTNPKYVKVDPFIFQNIPLQP